MNVSGSVPAGSLYIESNLQVPA